MFDDAFLDALSEDPLTAALEMSEALRPLLSKIKSQADMRQNYDELADAYAALEAIIEVSGLPFDRPSLGVDKNHDAERIYGFLMNIQRKLETEKANRTLSSARDRYRSRLGLISLYQFSDGDLKRIQDLINEMRDLVTSSELFTAKHKDRVLKKLESLQRELYKRMSNLDKLWGLIGEAGVALGKFGMDAKPFVDRIREIAEITWRTQARAEELPSSAQFPQLGSGEKQDSK